MSTNTPATRRSTRLASQDTTPAVTGAFPDPISGRTRRTSATPATTVAASTGGRTRRGRTAATPAASNLAAPLPPVQSTHSHAYGASGRARVADPSLSRPAHESAADALSMARDDAFARQDVSTSSRESSAAPSAVQSAGPRSSIPPIPEESEPSARSSRQSSIQQELPEEDTNVDATRSFGLLHEAGLVPPHGFHIERPTRGQILWRWMTNKLFAFRDWCDDNMPGHGALLFLGLLLAYLFILAFGVDIPQPDGTSLKSARESLYNSVSSVAQITSAGLQDLRQSGQRIADLNKQLADQGNRFDDLNSRYDIVNAELEKLKTILPDLTVVRRKDDGGGFELLDHFWNALENKVAGERSKGTKMPWDKWFRRNQEIVNEVHKSMTADDYNQHLGWAFKHYSLVTKDEVLNILRDHYTEFDSKYAKYDRKFTDVRDSAIERAAERYLAKHFKNSQHKLIEGAWAHKTLGNARMSLEQPNFMSPKLGAGIDPYLTSPTAKRTYSSWRTWLYGKSVTGPPSRPPIEALRNWEEAGDCWCSAAANADAAGADSASGKAQLGVMLAMPVYPTHLVVEHVPKPGTLEPGTAPREIELWIQVKSETVRDGVQAQIGAASWFTNCGDRGSLPEDYVCVGATTYDLDGWNHVQSSRLEVDLETLQVSTSKAVVRVKSSWGSPRVCLYRVRLLGKPAGGVV